MCYWCLLNHIWFQYLFLEHDAYDERIENNWPKIEVMIINKLQYRQAFE